MDSSFLPPIEQAHRGGFFLGVERSRRIQVIVTLASRLEGMVVVAGSDGEARLISERLTLRGVPVLLASRDEHALALSAADSSTTALVTTARFIEANGPVHSPLTVHLRPPFSARSYMSRLANSVSAVHVTFVTPEDRQRADQLRVALSSNSDDERSSLKELGDLIDLSTSDEPAAVEAPRRRFMFRVR